MDIMANPFKKTSGNMDQKKALGKGLGSLIASSGASKSQVKELPLEDVIRNPNQPRKLFSKKDIDELAASIEEKGVIQPLVVRHIGGGKYELIAGERRYRACKQIQLPKVPVVVKEIDDDEVLELALIENIQREDLNPIEESLAYRDLLSKFQYTQDELAKRLGKDRSSIANSLRLLKLPETIRQYVINNKLSMGHARALLAVDSRDLQIQMAKDIIENSLSVRDTENLIKKVKEGVDEGEDEETTQKTVSKVVSRSEVLRNIESKMKDRMKMMVKIKGNESKGKITISYSSEEEFNSLTQKLVE